MQAGPGAPTGLRQGGGSGRGGGGGGGGGGTGWGVRRGSDRAPTAPDLKESYKTDLLVIGNGCGIHSQGLKSWMHVWCAVAGTWLHMVAHGCAAHVLRRHGPPDAT